MKFNPVTQDLFTNDNQIIKRLYCPYKKNWEEMKQTSNVEARLCDTCDKAVLDTAQFTDSELLNLVRIDNSVCLTVDIHQDNLIVIDNDTI